MKLKIKKPLTKKELNDMKCSSCDVPGCESPLIFRPRCHFNSKPDIYYYDGQVIVLCSKCGNLVVNIAVKEDK